MDLLEFIPEGYDNAIPKSQLRDLTGMKDRDLRRAIESLRKENVIISRPDGGGYFIPTKKDLKKVQQWYLTEFSRFKSIEDNLKATKKWLRKAV